METTINKKLNISELDEITKRANAEIDRQLSDLGWTRNHKISLAETREIINEYEKLLIAKEK